jgi:hypothetical protein
MFEFSGDREANIAKAIEACRALIRSLSDPQRQPLEREAGYILAQALRLQVESLGLLENPDVREFLRVHDETRPTTPLRRFPDDFDDFDNATAGGDRSPADASR